MGNEDKTNSARYLGIILTFQEMPSQQIFAVYISQEPKSCIYSHLEQKANYSPDSHLTIQGWNPPRASEGGIMTALHRLCETKAPQANERRLVNEVRVKPSLGSHLLEYGTACQCLGGRRVWRL